MSAVKFVHVLKRIEALDRDINEIHALTSGIPDDRSYATSIKISLEQQVNNMLAERTKLMEVRIENPPENLDPNRREIRDPNAKEASSGDKFSFEIFEKEYYEWIDEKRNLYAGSEPLRRESREAKAPAKKSLSAEPKLETAAPLPSLAEKSLLPGKAAKEEGGGEHKSRADLLKDLPPLEY